MSALLLLGDSFSNAKACLCDEKQMWYWPIVEKTQSQLFDRTRAGASLEEISIKLRHALAEDIPVDQVLIGLPPLDRRPTLDMPWETNPIDQQKKETDYYNFFGRVNALDIPDKIIHFVHPLLVLANSMSSILYMIESCETRGIECLVVNMTHDFYQYNGVLVDQHPFTKKIFNELSLNKKFMPHNRSCKNICRENNVKPWDFEQFSWTGHHGAEGQTVFSKYVLEYIDKNQIFR